MTALATTVLKITSRSPENFTSWVTGSVKPGARIWQPPIPRLYNFDHITGPTLWRHHCPRHWAWLYETNQSLQLTHQDDGLVVSPWPRRTTKITKVVTEVLDTNQLSPEQAQQLAGKVVFLQSSMFGSVGRAALHPLYGRAANHDGRDHVDLTHALRTALRALVHLLQTAAPKKIFFTKSNTKAVIYTDAFFQQGEVAFSPSTLRTPTRWSTTRCVNYLNGWGYVVTVDGTAFYSHGAVDRTVLKAFCSRRAYIYFLEIAAHLLAVVDMHHLLPRQVMPSSTTNLVRQIGQW